MDEDRGTGRTTEQMRAAPQRALFVWCNDHLHYPKELARKHSRTDLMIVGPSHLDRAFELRGRTFGGVIVDHATRLSERQRENLHLLRPYVR